MHETQSIANSEEKYVYLLLIYLIGVLVYMQLYFISSSNLYAKLYTHI